MNGYDLSRNFVNFSFENPSKIKPNHYALYFFAIEHCNRLGWKKEYGLPTTMTMEAIGIKSYNTYIKTFNELVEYGFFNLIERSKNQYSANIIELSNNDKALDKALDKAFIKHATKQSESTQQSISSIDKQLTNKPITTEKEVVVVLDTTDDFDKYRKTYSMYAKKLYNNNAWIESISRMFIKDANNDINIKTIDKYLRLFLTHLEVIREKHEKENDFTKHFSSWMRIQPTIVKVYPKQDEIRYF